MVVKIANIWLEPLDLSAPIASELKETSSKIQNQSHQMSSNMGHFFGGKSNISFQNYVYKIFLF